VAKLEDRLRHELESIASPADPAGVVERVLARATRRRLLRRAQVAGLALAVIAGTIAGTYALSKVFRTSVIRPGGELSPLSIVPHQNGRIAFAESTGPGMRLVSIEPDGTDRQVIPTPSGMPWLPSWSPDGKKIAVAIFPTGAGERAIWVINADGSSPRRLASADNVSQPSWSPDCERIAYSASSGGTSDIHIVNVDGSDDHAVYSIPAPGTQAIFSAVFSPDGTKILFDQGTDSGMDIYLMDADGSNVEQLTTTGTDYDPHWSPDGTRIAFTRQGQGDQSDIYLMDADGSNVEQLTHGGQGETNLYPAWSPDDTKIAYLAGVRGGPGGLVVMNSEGSAPVTLVKGDVLGLSWQPLPG
jgi:tol-pal system beta propeller repeat protein TolB